MNNTPWAVPRFVVKHSGMVGTLCWLAVIVLAIGCERVAWADDPAPNIILIVSDDQGWQGTSVQMDPTIPGSRSDFHQTPNLEAIAAAGMRFSNAYASSAVCSPSRAAIHTGRSPAQLQMTDLPYATIGSHRYNSSYIDLPLTPPLPVKLDSEISTIPRLIKQTNPNYVAAHIGKWHLEDAGSPKPTHVGYDYADSPWGATDGTNPLAIFSLTNAANSFMEDQVNTNHPFFLSIAHWAVHSPIEALPETIEKYENLPPGTVHKDPNYAAMTEDLDTGVGMLLQKVRDLGIEDNTYIIYTSDHGAPTNLAQNTPLFRYKATLWEGGIRVPFIIQGPGIEAGSVSDVPIIATDLYATIGDIVGHNGSLPEGVEGASLLPLLENGGELPQGMETLQREYAENGELFFHWPHYFGVSWNFKTRPQSAVRDGDFKLFVRYGENGDDDEVFLFNLANDVRESWSQYSWLNLARSMPEKTEEMLTKLENWIQATDASMPYDVKEDVQLVWDAERPGTVPNGWRSTIDVDYKARETWSFEPNSQAPQQAAIQPHQPHLSQVAFQFDGDDGMNRVFFDVADDAPRKNTPNSGVPDFNRSTSLEFWVRLNALNQEQVLFESGDGTGGLSVTFGDGNNDGQFDEIRMRALGADGKSIVVTSELDRFANPTRDFVQVVTVLNDDDADRYAAIYVNGALFGQAAGLEGAENTIQWDSYDRAGLGRTSGSGLGANGGTGDQPFGADNFIGQLAFMRFYNHAIDGEMVRSNYNAMLHDVDLGIAAVSGTVQSPDERPSDVAEGAFESDNTIFVIHERNDQLDEALSLDILPVAGETYGNGGLTEGIDGQLATGTDFSSYLLHFDPLGQPTNTETVVGSVTFESPILGLLVDQTSLVETDSLLGAIGLYTTDNRELDLSGNDFLTVSDDLLTLTVSLYALGNEVVQLRVLTDLLLPSAADFNGDGIVDAADYTVWRDSLGQNVIPGTGADAFADGVIDQHDYDFWRRFFGNSSTGSSSAIPEPSSAILAALGLLGLVLRRRPS